MENTKRILLIDSDIKSQYDKISCLLAHTLEFLHHYKDSKEEHILEEMKKYDIEYMWDLQKRLFELEKQMYRGEIII